MKLFISSLMLIFSLGAMAQSSTWFEVPTNTTKQLNTISFGSPSVGYIGGNDSLLLKTTDGGQTWLEVNYSGIEFFSFGDAIVNLKFINEETGFMAVGPYTGIYKTVDGGLTWTLLETPGNMCYNQGLFFWDENNGIVGGSGCFQGEQIAVYTDGNLELATVNSETFDSGDIVVDIDFFDSDFGLAVSPDRFLRTTDGGQTWDTIPNFSGYPITSIEIVNDTLAYAGYIDEQSSGFGLLVTHDSGLTWAMESDMATFAYPDYKDVKTSSNGYIFTAGAYSFENTGIIFENKGNGWSYENVGQNLNSLDSYGDSTVFAVGDSGLVVTNVNVVLGISERYSHENELMLYPNPAGDLLKFTVRDVNTSRVSQVTIWNLQGQLVYSEYQSHSSIDINSLTTGSYILEVQTGDRKLRKQFVKQ